MGYNSEVIIAVTKKAFNLHADQEIRDTLKEYDVLILERNAIYYIIFEIVKWYDEYKEIKLFKEFISKCLEEDEDSAAFLRVGEEEGDIERRGDCSDFEIYPVTKASCPGGKRVSKNIFACNSIRFIVEE